MPYLSVLFIRTALIYLISGFSLGGLLLFNKAFTIDQSLWLLLPAHYFILFYGWIIQMIFGVGFWIIPKFDKSYVNSLLVWFAYFSLNAGLILLFISFLALFLNYEIKIIYIISTVLIYSGIASFIIHIWPRVRLFVVIVPK